MDQFETNKKLFSDAIKLYYSESKPTDAIEKLDLVLTTDKINSFAYSFKATILKDLNKTDEALKVIDEGLGHNLKDHVLLKLKAEILSRILLRPNDALPFIQQAQLYFEESSKTLKEFIQSLPEYDKQEYLINYLGTRTELQILNTEIIQLANSIFVFNRAENIEKQLVGERVRIIELLGLFTAIFAFIFSGVQIFTKLSVTDALVLQSGLAVLLIVFLLALHMVINPMARRKNLIALLVILLFVLLILPFYAKFLGTTSFLQSTSTQRNIEKEVGDK